MSGALPAPALTLVVTTLGRVEALGRFLQSVENQLTARDSIVIIAQDRYAGTVELVESHRPRLACVVLVGSSARGASRGRNTGVALSACSADDLLLFPNDTSWFPEGTLDAIRAGVGRNTGSVVVQTTAGPRFNPPAPGTPLDMRTAWLVIEMGLVIRRDDFDSIGGFDENIGTGADSPWQAGEVTDLLLRLLSKDRSLADRFVWLPPATATIGGNIENEGLSAREAAWKLRAYGRGVGHVYRVHRFPRVQRLGLIAAGALVGIRRPEYPLYAGLPSALGRFEGVTGRTFGSDKPAVRR
jgi:hypothetical protein